MVGCGVAIFLPPPFQTVPTVPTLKHVPQPTQSGNAYQAHTCNLERSVAYKGMGRKGPHIYKSIVHPSTK